MTAAVHGCSDAAAVLAAAAQVKLGANPCGVTAYLPALVGQQDAVGAYALVTRFGHIAEIHAESMAVLDTSGLSAAQKREMLAAISPLFTGAAPDAAAALASVAARSARYGFCFPRWRFLTQRIGDNPALMESYGFMRLERATDVRAPDLPRHDPARDLFGMGFLYEDAAWTVEYRRAYVLCARRGAAGAALVIRNSSYFFGRDRLAYPLYVAWGDVSPQDLRALDEDSFAIGGIFTPWPAAMAQRPDIAEADKNQRLSLLLDRLDAEEHARAHWMAHDGAVQVKAFIAAAAPFYMGLNAAGAPPWFPSQVAPASAEHFDSLCGALESAENAAQVITLFSGPAGDYPTPPQGRRGE